MHTKWLLNKTDKNKIEQEKFAHKKKRKNLKKIRNRLKGVPGIKVLPK